MEKHLDSSDEDSSLVINIPSISIISLFACLVHRFSSFHDEEKNKLSFTASNISFFSSFPKAKTNSSFELKKWSSSFSKLLQHTIHSDIKSLNDLSMESGTWTLAFEEVIYQLRSQQLFDLANQMDQCLKRLLLRFSSSKETKKKNQLYLFYPSSASMEIPFASSKLLGSSTFTLNSSALPSHAMASILVLLRNLAEPSSVSSSFPCIDSSLTKQEYKQSIEAVFPSLSHHSFSLNYLSTHTEHPENPSLESFISPLSSSSNSISDDFLKEEHPNIPYHVLSNNPTLHTNLFRDPWKVTYSPSNFKLSSTLSPLLSPSLPSTSLLSSPSSFSKFQSPVLRSSSSSSSSFFASLPIKAQPHLPPLDPIHTSSILDWVPYPSTISLTPSVSLHTRSSYSDLDSIVLTSKATLNDSISRTSISNSNSKVLSSSSTSSLSPSSDSSFIVYSNFQKDSVPNILTWDNVDHPSVACFGERKERIFCVPFVTHRPSLFESKYETLSYDVFNPPILCYKQKQYISFVLKLLSGLESPAFVWSDINQTFHLRTAFRIEGYSLSCTQVLNDTCVTMSTQLRLLEWGASCLRESNSKGTLLQAFGSALYHCIHELRQSWNHQFHHILSPRLLYQKVLIYSKAIDTLSFLFPFDPLQPDLSLLFVNPFDQNTRRSDLSPASKPARTLTDHHAPVKSVHVLDLLATRLKLTDSVIPTEQQPPLIHTWLFQIYLATLKPILNWIQAWLSSKSSGLHSEVIKFLDPHSEFWVTWVFPLSFDAPHTFWTSGYVLSPACSTPSTFISSLFNLEIQEFILRIQKWYSVLHSFVNKEDLFFWFKELSWPTTWDQMQQMSLSLTSHHKTIDALPVFIFLDNQQQKSSSEILDLAQKMTHAIEHRKQLWQRQTYERRFHAFTQKQALLNEIKVFLDNQFIWRSHQDHQDQVRELEHIYQHLSNATQWNRKVALERKEMLKEYQLKIDAITKLGMRLAWRKARLALRQGIRMKSELESLDEKLDAMNENVISTNVDSNDNEVIMELITSPSETSFQKIDEEEKEEKVEELVGETTEDKMEVDTLESEHVSFSSDMSVEPLEQSSTSEINLETHLPSPTQNSNVISTVFPDQSLSNSKNPLEPASPDSFHFPKRDDIELNTKTASLTTPPITPISKPPLVEWPRFSTSLESPRFFPSLLSSPSPTSSFYSSEANSPSTQSTVPFTIAFDFFQSWLKQHLFYTEARLIYHFFVHIRPLDYIQWIHQFFLMKNATFRDQLCDLIFSESILFSVSDPAVFTSRLNNLLSHETSLSFSLVKEKISKAPQDLGFCEFLILDLRLQLPSALFFYSTHLRKYQSLFQFLLKLLYLKSILVKLPVSQLRFQALGLITALFMGISRGFHFSIPTRLSPTKAWNKFLHWHENELEALLKCIEYGQNVLKSIFKVILELGIGHQEASLMERFSILLKVYLDDMPATVKKKIGSTWSHSC